MCRAKEKRGAISRIVLSISLKNGSLQMLDGVKWLAKAAFYAVIRSKMDRQKVNVQDEYSEGWASYSKYLNSCIVLEDWLQIKGVEDVPHFCNISGKLTYQPFYSMEFNRRKILDTLQREFPDAKSVTEYGCGIGRNLLFLKQHMPHVEFYGYELCKPGVEIAQSAAKKFGLDVNYSQLDYVGGGEIDYVFQKTDVAFTMYSLEQLPNSNKLAMENILRHTNYGSIHIEPVPENYPYSFRGIIGRLDHWKANYLKNFEKNISDIAPGRIKTEPLDCSHTPLMFPTLYVIKKNS